MQPSWACLEAAAVGDIFSYERHWCSVWSNGVNGFWPSKDPLLRLQYLVSDGGSRWSREMQCWYKNPINPSFPAKSDLTKLSKGNTYFRANFLVLLFSRFWVYDSDNISSVPREEWTKVLGGLFGIFIYKENFFYLQVLEVEVNFLSRLAWEELRRGKRDKWEGPRPPCHWLPATLELLCPLTEWLLRLKPGSVVSTFSPFGPARLQARGERDRVRERTANLKFSLSLSCQGVYGVGGAVSSLDFL